MHRWKWNLHLIFNLVVATEAKCCLELRELKAKAIKGKWLFSFFIFHFSSFYFHFAWKKDCHIPAQDRVFRVWFGCLGLWEASWNKQVLGLQVCELKKPSRQLCWIIMAFDLIFFVIARCYPYFIQLVKSNKLRQSLWKLRFFNHELLIVYYSLNILIRFYFLIFCLSTTRAKTKYRFGHFNSANVHIFVDAAYVFSSEQAAERHSNKNKNQMTTKTKISVFCENRDTQRNNFVFVC